MKMLKRWGVLAAIVLLAATVAVPQGGEVTPGDNLIVEGIPKIPASLAAEVGRYTDFRSAGLTSWHPTRREMLISTRFAETNQVHQVKMPGGARTQLTFFPDRVASSSYNPKTGDYFIFLKDTGGNEVAQGYRYDLATGNVALLTDGKSRHSGGVWSTAGDKIAYGRIRVQSPTEIFLQIREMNPQDPASDRQVVENKGAGWFTSDWSPDDKKLLVIEFISANESYIHEVDVASGEKKLLTPKSGTEKVAWGGAAYAKNGRGFYTTTDMNSEFQRLAYMDFATLKPTILTAHINWDVDSFELSPDGKTMAFVTNENGINVLHLMDLSTNKEKKVPPLPAGSIFGLEWHENGRDLGFSLNSARSATDAYSLDVKTGKVERWTYSETGGLNTASFSEPELIQWKSFDGMTITGFLYRPAAKFTGKRPVIVNVHGGPEAQFQPGFLGRNNYYLNEMGVALIFPNVRGSSGFGKTFLKLDNGFLREDSYKDMGALLDWIKQQPGLDGDRIMVTGGSYGGHMTFVAATYYPEKIRCALAVVGLSNLRTFLENTDAFRRDLRRVEYGDERDPQMREFMERIAPLNNAQKITKPLFIVQGYNDPRAPRSEALQMVETVKKVGTPVWFLMAKDEGHGFVKRKNQDFQFYATVMFVRDNLLK